MADPDVKASKNPDLVPRLIVALVGAPALILASIFGPNWLLWAIVLGSGGIAAWEYLRMTLQRDFRLDGVSGVVSVVLMLSAIYWFDTPIAIGGTLFGVTVLMFVAVLTSIDKVEESARRIGALFSGFVYLTVLYGGYIYLIKATPRGETAAFQAGWFLFPMFVVWAGDTGAYFVGRAFGKTKLAPRVSPGKSWEGAAGGLAASVAGAFLAVWILPLPVIPAWLVITMAIPGAILGQIGDLCESLIKRATGFKDSSSLLYGHGGMLDRVDALIFAAPWILIARELWLPL